VRRRAKKLLLVVTIVVICVNLCSCFNYRDVNRVVFTTTLVIDYDDDREMVIIYLETFRPYRDVAAGTEKGQRILFKGMGKTIYEAVRDANIASSYRLNYTQNKAVVFTEKIAERGLEEVVDFLDRHQEMLVRPYVFVFFGDPQALLQQEFREESYLGTYLFALVENVRAASRALNITVNEYLNKRVKGSRSYVITGMRIRTEDLEDKIELEGAGVIVKDRMVDIMPRVEAQGYNFLIDKVGEGTLEVTNPHSPDHFITLSMLNSDTRTNVKYVKGKFRLIKDIYVITSISEAQHDYYMTEESLKKVAKNAEHNIKRFSTEVFNKYKAKGIDIFELEEEIHRRYPKLKLEDPIKDTELDIRVTVRVEGSSTKTNTQ
jgi:spore germination protein KC